MSIGLFFSGQGAQTVGMGKSLYEHSEIAQSLYDQANEILGWDLKEISFEGPDEALTETKVCQPALYVHGYAVFSILKDQGKLPNIVAATGLSLGELTALASAEVFDFATGLQLVAKRGELMQLACENTTGSMASLIGGSKEAAELLCKEHDLDMANLNCPGQIVVSGSIEGVEKVVAAAKPAGFKLAKQLNVAGAYHSRLMQSAADEYEHFLEDFEFKRPSFAVYTNTTGKSISDPDAIKAALVKQITSSVLFEDCIRNSHDEQGVTQFVECGVAKVIAGLVRRTNKEWPVISIQEFEEIPESL